MGHKVLLVDGDPQCNLTALFLGSNFDEYYEKEETKKQNIKDGVKVAFDGKPTPVTAINCPQAEPKFKFVFITRSYEFIWVWCSTEFCSNSNYGFNFFEKFTGRFYDLIDKTCRVYDIEFVFIDLNPGLSSINQNLFLISDAFIIPTNPDTFSLMAIKSLSAILPRWVKWKEQNIDSFSDSAYPLPNTTPKFIGEIAQRFNIRNGKATSPYRDKITELTDLTKQLLVPVFAQNNMLFEEQKYVDAGIDDSYCLEEIKDFQGLSPKSQIQMFHVYELEDSELRASGAALQGMKENRRFFMSYMKK